MARTNPKNTSRWNVLIAEDDLNSRAQLLRGLSRLADCVVVDNGIQAIEAYRKAVKKKKSFDFILLDVTMPSVDGFEVLRTIRADEEKAALPATNNKSPKEITLPPFKPACIIMITAFKDSLMELYNMGWDEYITKPIEADKLIHKMQKLII